MIGVGNEWRGDDAAGIAVARELIDSHAPPGRVTVHEGECMALVETWGDELDVVVVDAASSGAAAGTVHRFDASQGPLPAALLRSSTHAFGVPDAVELARSLDRLPRTLRVYAIEGRSFGAGDPLTPSVARAVTEVADELRALFAAGR